MTRTMKEVTTEYNKLTGKNLTRFTTIEAGEKEIAKAKMRVQAKPSAPHRVEKPSTTKSKEQQDATEKKYKMRISVDGVKYRSVIKAFAALGLPINKHGKFRLGLHEHKKAVFEHEGKKHKFVLL